MTKCKDGRKHVIVKEYEKKDGKKISKHERSCPTKKSKVEEEYFICCVCGEEYSSDDTHDVEVKGHTKQICKECVDSIKGLV